MNVPARHPTRLVDDKPRTSRHLDAPWNDDVHRLPFLESSESTRLQCGQTCQRAFGSGMQHGSPPQLGTTQRHVLQCDNAPTPRCPTRRLDMADHRAMIHTKGGELLPPEDACLLLREFCQARH